MNRESLPLILAILLPFILVLVVLLYYYGIDLTLFFRKVPIIYYIILAPIALGFTVAVVKYFRPD